MQSAAAAGQGQQEVRVQPAAAAAGQEGRQQPPPAAGQGQQEVRVQPAAAAGQGQQEVRVQPAAAAVGQSRQPAAAGEQPVAEAGQEPIAAGGRLEQELPALLGWGRLQALAGSSSIPSQRGAFSRRPGRGLQDPLVPFLLNGAGRRASADPSGLGMDSDSQHRPLASAAMGGWGRTAGAAETPGPGTGRRSLSPRVRRRNPEMRERRTRVLGFTQGRRTGVHGVVSCPCAGAGQRGKRRSQSRGGRFRRWSGNRGREGNGGLDHDGLLYIVWNRAGSRIHRDHRRLGGRSGLAPRLAKHLPPCSD